MRRRLLSSLGSITFGGVLVYLAFVLHDGTTWREALAVGAAFIAGGFLPGLSHTLRRIAELLSLVAGTAGRGKADCQPPLFIRRS